MAPEEPLQTSILYRLTTCGSGFYRVAIMQVLFAIGAELREQLRENDDLGSVPPRHDLLKLTEEYHTWHFRCIEAGETNIKGYVFAVLMSAHNRGMMKGFNDAEMAAFLTSHVHEAEEKCRNALERMLAQLQSENNVDLPDQMSLETLTGSVDGWGALVSYPVPCLPFRLARYRLGINQSPLNVPSANEK